MSTATAHTRGCLTCRSRKKKCDGNLPHCGLCIRSKKVCPGYPDGGTLKIRDMTQISERKVQLRTAGRDRDRHASSPKDIVPKIQFINTNASLDPQLNDLQRNQTSQQGEIPRSVSIDWQQIAVPRFFADYSSRTDIFDGGQFHFLPEVYSQRMSSVHFDEALRAVAYMSLANQLGKDDLSIQARKFYGSAIIRVAKRLQAKDVTDDTLVVSSLLFSIFEIISIKAVPKGFWKNAHDFGRISLLRARGTGGFEASLMSKIFSLILLHNLTKCLSSHIDPPDDLLAWMELADIRDIERSGPSSQIIKCSWGIAKFCAAAQVLFDSTEKDDRWVLNLLQLVKKGIAIENRCEEWRVSTLKYSNKFVYRTCRPRSTGIKISNISQKYPVHFYHDNFVAWCWNYFRACRIRVHEVILHCITCIQSHPGIQSISLDHETTGRESRAIIAEMVFDVCSSTYFCLGQIDSKGQPRTERPIPHWGYHAFWPFYVAMVSAEKGGENEVWLRDSLEYINNVMGIELAGMLARRPKTEPWDIR